MANGTRAMPQHHTDKPTQEDANVQDMPGYKSIALDIAERIVRGELPPKSKISGRTLLASHYHVSPETIRKAIGLLKDENIVSVSQGKEITVLSARLAQEYITKNQYLKTVYSLKQELEMLLKEKQEMDNKFERILKEMIVFSDRLSGLKAYNPVEITVRESSHAAGKTIANLQLWQQTGATIIALRRGTDISISPGPHVILREQDVLVVVGDEQVQQRTDRYINQVRDN
jgi:K+/H+ antiporter YhaU regulatory subunit KhtT